MPDGAQTADSAGLIYELPDTPPPGLGVTLVPDALKQLPDVIRKVFGPPITLAGLSAIVLTLVLPEPKDLHAAEPADDMIAEA